MRTADQDLFWRGDDDKARLLLGVWDFCSALSPRQRVVFELVTIRGLSLRRTATILKISKQAVEMHLARAIKKRSCVGHWCL